MPRGYKILRKLKSVENRDVPTVTQPTSRRKRGHTSLSLSDPTRTFLLLALAQFSFPDPTLRFVRRGRTAPETSGEAHVRKRGTKSWESCKCSGLCAHLPHGKMTARVVWYGGSTLYRFTSHPNPVASPSTRVRHNPPPTEELSGYDVTSRMQANHQTYAKLQNDRSGGWGRIEMPVYSTPQVSHGVFSVLTACPAQISDWVPLSALSRDYRLD